MTKRNIQFIATSGRLHEYNFIKFVLPNDMITFYSDTGHSDPSSEEIEQYYRSHSIRIVEARKFDGVKPRLFRILLNLISGITAIVKSRSIEYDYCFISYLSTRRAILSFFIPRSRKTILIAHGSDILRKSNYNELFFNLMLKRAYRIIFNSENVQNQFTRFYGDKYVEKSEYIPFPSSSFERVESAVAGLTSVEARREFNLPTDKIIVICGHTSTFEEQFELLIPALENVRDDVLQKCHFVFPMTYGNGDYESYRDMIEKLLAKSKLQYSVLRDYCTVDEMARLHMCSDVHISSIKTDALSIFMQEELYLGARLIYGEWLDYPELRKNGIVYETFKSFQDLPFVFEKVLNTSNFTEPANSRNSVKRLKSISNIVSSWNEIMKE